MDMPLADERSTDHENDLVGLTADVVSAYVSHNSLSSSDLPRLIADTYSALKGVSQGTIEKPTPELIPATSVRKSVTPDYLICLDDGKKFRSMKRHLAGLGMTPDQYRSKWNLPYDYPMVAPNYAATRSALAKKIGLGRKPEQGKPKAGAKGKVRTKA